VDAELGAANGIDDDAGAVRAVPNFELELDVQRNVAEGRAFHADVAPLAVVQPRHVVARANVDVVRGQLVVELAGDGVRLRDLLRLQALALEHVHEVGVTTEVELVRAVQLHAAVGEEAGERTVDDGRADLALDVVADDWHAGLFEALGPVAVRVTRDKDGDAVDESTPRREHLLDVPL